MTEPTRGRFGKRPCEIPREAGSLAFGQDEKVKHAQRDLKQRVAKAEERDIEAKRKRTELAGIRQDIAARRKYARRIFYLIVGWLIADLVLLLLQGFLNHHGKLTRSNGLSKWTKGI